VNLGEALSRLPDFPHAVLVVLDEGGYPLSVATSFRVVDGTVEVTPASLGQSAVRDAVAAQLVVSHIRPYPGVGYDQRRYIELSGTLSVGGPGWRFFLATRLPFLTATIVPVLLGLASAAYDRHFSPGLAALTLLGAMAVHLGLNVANDIFDTLSGVDAANLTPTKFSGGSRVLQYGLVSLRQMTALAAVFYGVAIIVGLVLVAISGLGLLWLGVAGVLISYFYTAPPLRLVHRGLGELCVALGFGPIMVLGAYFVQTGHYALRPLILSIPVAILVMLILYANEVPDRFADAKTGKRTLVVRMQPAVVIRGYVAAVAVAYLVVIVGVVFGVLPWPTLISLLTIPLAYQTWKGLKAHYDSPYQLMSYLGKNVSLHLYTGLLLVIGVLLGIIVRR